MTDTNEKIRALFLTALMVMSVFGMTVGFVGSAAANHGTDADRTFSGPGELSGSLVYSGQVVTVNVDTQGLSAGDDVQLRESTGSDSSNPVQTLTVENHNGNLVVSFDTSGRPTGDYFLQGGDIARGDSLFEIVEQDLEASFSGDTVVNDGSTVDLDINSDLRNGYDVNVSVDGFDADDYESLFGDVSDTYDDDAVTLTGAEGSYELDFSDIDTGNYTFDVEVLDTTAESTANITVDPAEDADASFINDPYQGAVGDNVTVEFETNDENVEFELAGPDGEYVVNTTINGIDTDETVNVTFNSFLAGQDEADVDDVLTIDNGNPADSYEADFQGDFRLAPEDYDLSVSPTGENAAEYDFAGLTLTERSTGDASTIIAPADEGLDTSDLSNWHESDTVATGDNIVVPVEVNGVFAYAEDASSNGLNFTIEHQNPGTYAEGQTFDASDEVVEPVVDEEMGAIYFVIHMDETPDDFEFEDGQQWEATFEIDGDYNPYVDDEETASTQFSIVEDDISLDLVESPYDVTPTENATVSGQSTLAPGTPIEVRLRQPGADGFGVVTISDEISENGTWSVTQDFSAREEGEEFEIRVREDIGGENYIEEDAVFSNTTEANTVADVEALEERIEELESENQNLSDQVSTLESERDQLQSDLEEAEQTISDLQNNQSEGTVETRTVEVTRTVMVTPTDGDDGDSDTGGQPGFGIAIAVVALLAAALLGVRRRA